MHYKVSVIIPVYNVEQYLEQCLDSIVNQTLKEIEIIIVDDGSTDGSGEIVDKYKEKYTNVVAIHKEHKGPGAARNLGMACAQGEYLYFMDSDDCLDINALKMLYQEAEQKDLDLLLFSGVAFTEDKRLKSIVYRFCYLRTKHLYTVMSGKDGFVLTHAEGEYITSVCTRFYNRMYLKKINLKYSENIIHEDEDFGFLTLAMAEKIEIIEDVFFYRRLRQNSIMTSRQGKRGIEGYMYAWNCVMEFYNNCEWSNREKEELFLFAVKYLFDMTRVYGESDRKERRKCNDLIRVLDSIIKETDLIHNYSISCKKRLQIKLYTINKEMYIFLYTIFRRIKEMSYVGDKRNAF